ncbi:hypothetical protein AB205_0016630 [Aquarana catesbeiana]|uniref:Uncharacterized protein n=1 Tax=Aquarana catesbeiana TaxID=8400 RepID=A0A2G9SIG9_AQUCT|nr:hypothetical protein AB205_0016630 [Aquarana catesbeiana]
MGKTFIFCGKAWIKLDFLKCRQKGHTKLLHHGKARQRNLHPSASEDSFTQVLSPVQQPEQFYLFFFFFLLLVKCMRTTQRKLLSLLEDSELDTGIWVFPAEQSLYRTAVITVSRVTSTPFLACLCFLCASPQHGCFC